MNEQQPTGAQKRRFYAVAFCIAFGIDLAMSLSRDVPYRPTLIGMAIMITAVLWWIWSWIRER